MREAAEEEEQQGATKRRWVETSATSISSPSAPHPSVPSASVPSSSMVPPHSVSPFLALALGEDNAGGEGTGSAAPSPQGSTCSTLAGATPGFGAAGAQLGASTEAGEEGGGKLPRRSGSWGGRRPSLVLGDGERLLGASHDRGPLGRPPLPRTPTPTRGGAGGGGVAVGGVGRVGSSLELPGTWGSLGGGGGSGRGGSRGVGASCGGGSDVDVSIASDGCKTGIVEEASLASSNLHNISSGHASLQLTTRGVDDVSSPAASVASAGTPTPLNVHTPWLSLANLNPQSILSRAACHNLAQDVSAGGGEAPTTLNPDQPAGRGLGLVTRSASATLLGDDTNGGAASIRASCPGGALTRTASFGSCPGSPCAAPPGAGSRPDLSRLSMESYGSGCLSVEGSEASLSCLAPGGIKPPTAGALTWTKSSLTHSKWATWHFIPFETKKGSARTYQPHKVLP